MDENAANGTTVGITAAASDADATTNAITYTLHNNDGGRFAIDANTGVVTVAGAIEPRSGRRQCATSRCAPPRPTAPTPTRRSRSTINDVDEFDVGAVTDTNATANAVNENAVNGTTVGITAAASDADATTNTITYSLQDNDGGRFAIDANTGVVTVAGAIDREADGASRNITVRATSADGSYTDQVFTIDDQRRRRVRHGRGDRLPTPPPTRWPRTRRIGTTVGLTGLASDADATATITYSPGRRCGRTVRDPRHHRRGHGQRGAGLRDGHQPLGHHPRHQLGRLVLDPELHDHRDRRQRVGHHGASATRDGAADYVLENAANGTTVGLTAFADDPDGTNTVSYSLDDDAGGRFAIHATTGVVTVAGAINREAAGSYDITVRATSSDTTTTTRTFTITIGDVDEFDVTARTDSERGGQRGGRERGQRHDGRDHGRGQRRGRDDQRGHLLADTTTRADGLRSTPTRAWSRWPAAHRPRRRPPRTTSRCGPPRPTARYTDQAFTINVNDVDEFDVGAVSDTNAAANAVNENAVNGTTVGITAAASDADATTNAITYSLQDNDGGRFAIDANTGVVTVAGAIDREADGASRNITVRATSADGSLHRPGVHDHHQRRRRVRHGRGHATPTPPPTRWPKTRRRHDGRPDGPGQRRGCHGHDHLLAGRQRGRTVRDPRHHRRGDGQRGAGLRDGHQPLGHHPRHQLGRLVLHPELLDRRDRRQRVGHHGASATPTPRPTTCWRTRPTAPRSA